MAMHLTLSTNRRQYVVREIAGCADTLSIAMPRRRTADEAQEHGNEQRNTEQRERATKHEASPSPAGADILGREPLAVGTPTGRAEDHAHRLAHRACGEYLSEDGKPFVEGNANRIEGLDILDDAVTRRLFVSFRREGTEQAVPHHQHAGIVAIEVAGV